MLNLFMQAAPVARNPLIDILPLIAIFGIFWFLLIRPQQKRAAEHRQTLTTIARGDVVVTNGGIIGKVTKATDDELTVEVSEGMRIRVLRSMIADVRRPEPANDTTSKKPAKKSKK